MERTLLWVVTEVLSIAGSSPAPTLLFCPAAVSAGAVFNSTKLKSDKQGLGILAFNFSTLISGGDRCSRASLERAMLCDQQLVHTTLSLTL